MIKLQIQLPEITIYTYGMNSPGQYAPDKQSRLKVKFPLDPLNKDITNISEKFQKLMHYLKIKIFLNRFLVRKNYLN